MYSFLIPFLYAAFLQQASSIKCYACDNTKSEACGRDFKAYQYEAVDCHPDDYGVIPKCGKQEQPPDHNGWVGVLRWCYYSGHLPDINETNGCHEYYHPKNNFTALYCFCDTHYCNGATSPVQQFLNLTQFLLYISTSALFLTMNYFIQ